MEWLIAGIIATASLFGGAIISAVDTGVENYRAQQEYALGEKQRKEKYDTDVDLLKLELDEKTKNEQLKNKQINESLDLKYNQEVNDANLKFGIAKDEANRQADHLDTQSDVAEKLSANAFNLQLGQLSAEQLFATYGFNQAAAESGMSQGQQLSALAASGTRAGSSLSAAVDLQAAVSANQLQMQEDAQRKTSALNVDRAVFDLRSSINNIGFNRDNADYTRDSFEEGGAQFKLFQNNLKNLQDSYTLSKRQQQEAFLNNLTDYTTQYAAGLAVRTGQYNREKEAAAYSFNSFNEDAPLRFFDRVFGNQSALMAGGMNAYTTFNKFGVSNG